jgi:uncharacterized protein YjbI with pentapeptide repeats
MTMKGTSTAQLRKWVLVGLGLGALVSLLSGILLTGDWGGLLLNVGAEFSGALATYVLLELFIRRREEEEVKKAELINQLRSQVPEVAVAAAEELRRRGWLYDGSLRWANLSNVTLQGVNLTRANLQGVDLAYANLQESELTWANLQGARLIVADLQGAILNAVNLQKAHLTWANLQGADLRKADLRETDLGAANLQGAKLQDAKLQGTNLLGRNLIIRVEVPGEDLQKADLQDDRVLVRMLDNAIWNGQTKVYTEGYQQATLPDGTKWTPGTDIARFTDHNHPDFWSPTGT